MLKTYGGKTYLVYSSGQHQRYHIVMLLDTPGMVLVQRLNLGIGNFPKILKNMGFQCLKLMVKK